MNWPSTPAGSSPKLVQAVNQGSNDAAAAAPEPVQQAANQGSNDAAAAAPEPVQQAANQGSNDAAAGAILSYPDFSAAVAAAAAAAVAAATSRTRPDFTATPTGPRTRPNFSATSTGPIKTRRDFSATSAEPIRIAKNFQAQDPDPRPPYQPLPSSNSFKKEKDLSQHQGQSTQLQQWMNETAQLLAKILVLNTDALRRESTNNLYAKVEDEELMIGGYSAATGWEYRGAPPISKFWNSNQRAPFPPLPPPPVRTSSLRAKAKAKAKATRPEDEEQLLIFL